MKTFQKIALVSAIATAPFAAQAELVSMDEASMGATTGQAGVTIELGVDMTIGSIDYTTAGTLKISDIGVSAADDSAVQIKQTIDVSAANGLEIGVSDITNLKATVGSINMGNGGTIGALRVDADITGISNTIKSGGKASTGGVGGLTIGAGVTIADLDVMYIDGALTTDADKDVTGSAGSSVFIDSISVTGLSMTQTIDVVDHDTNGAAAGGVQGALSIGSGAMSGTISIGGIKFLTAADTALAVVDTSGDLSAQTQVAAAKSIGSIALNDFSMAGSTTVIYAH